jgi:hypothetical protein
MANRITSAFLKFHKENPQVYFELRNLALRWQARFPNKRCSISMLYEVLRWNLSLRINSTDEFKLNNNFRSRYARMLISCNPEFAGLFETRPIHQREDFDNG